MGNGFPGSRTASATTVPALPASHVPGVARVLGVILHDAACPEFQPELHSHNHTTAASDCPPHVVVMHVAAALQRVGHVSVVHERSSAGMVVPVHRVRQRPQPRPGADPLY